MSQPKRESTLPSERKRSSLGDQRAPWRDDRDDRVKLDVPFEDALRALLRTPPQPGKVAPPVNPQQRRDERGSSDEKSR